MVFSSTTFLFLFFPIVFIICICLNGWATRAQNGVLLLFSLVFFAWAQPQYLWIMLFSILLNYFSAISLDKVKNRKNLLILAIIVNLAFLVCYKYCNFIIKIQNPIFGRNLPALDIVLPIGISFFTFQGLSYVVDVYRGTVPAQRNPLKVALYISLFPQLVAGPIVRYTDVLQDINSRRASADDIYAGFMRFFVGLSKKIIIANTMSTVVDSVWEQNVYHNPVWLAWLSSIAYSLQIYYDFSGYSDMAIGLGRIFGFHFNENFNLPYTAKSISEFWRRWHISLSSWFRDYVYIPLGGNQRCTYRNLAIVFLLTGLWHGADWTFVVWGCLHGLLILWERASDRNKVSKHPLLGVMYTLFAVNLAWVFFRADSLAAAISCLGDMFGIGASQSAYYIPDVWCLLIMAAGILFATPLPAHIRKKLHGEIWSVVDFFAVVLLLLFSIMKLVSGTSNPFIYFQF